VARETTRRCDICKKQTPKIVAKLFYAPMFDNGEKRKGAIHTNYTDHLDVGICCALEGGSGKSILKFFKWQPRKTREEYLRSRRAG
jgi:hypothetical protein